jgi:two-component system sensor histidine kinase/response regulator
VANHEYNTPLSGILGFVTLLMEHYKEFDEEDSLSMLGMIKTCGLRLKRSLDNLRFMEELQQMDPANASFFSNGVSQLDAEIVHQQISKVNDRQDEEANCRIDVDSAYVAISEASLRVVLDELIDNAYKFSKGSHPILITGRKTENQYQLTILNHGQWFKPEDIARIAPYVQFDRKNYEQQGSGLGLSIVKKLLDLNHCTLAIDSLPTGETSVNVIFQLA